MRPRWCSLFFVIVSLPFLTACDGIGDAGAERTPEADSALVGPTWRLQSFQPVAGRPSGPGRPSIDLRFSEDGTFIANSVNTISGSYTAGTNVLSTSDTIATTYVGLPPESKEEKFIAALTNASTYLIQGDRLRISCGKRGILNFEARSAQTD